MKKRGIAGVSLLAVAIVIVAGIIIFFAVQPAPVVSKAWVRGNPNASVTIVEFSDFQCPFCGRAQPTLERILSDYAGRVNLEFRHYPLPFHKFAQKASEAAECAGEQGKFWEYHDALFLNQNWLDVDRLKQYAKEFNLDASAFNSCLDSGKMSGKINGDINEGNRKGVSGTPAFFVNGQLVSGAQPYDVFRSVIESKLGG